METITEIIVFAALGFWCGKMFVKNSEDGNIAFGFLAGMGALGCFVIALGLLLTHVKLI